MALSILRGLAGIAVALTALGPATAAGQEIKVALLGTGSPPPVMNRFGPSILVEVGGRKFLFDAGRGALQRLAQLRISWQDVDGVFDSAFAAMARERAEALLVVLDPFLGIHREPAPGSCGKEPPIGNVRLEGISGRRWPHELRPRLS